MGTDDICHAGLTLGLGFPSTPVEPAQKTQLHKPIKGATLGTAEIIEPEIIEPSLTLALSGDSYVLGVPKKPELATGNKVVAAIEDYSVGPAELYRRQASPHGTVSSFSSPRVKGERDEPSWEEVEAERVSSKPSDEDDVDAANARKKLRLTKEQSAVLEESFKRHSTLNPRRKLALAGKLNLRPRQVEVWFQNRRARTKLKQTEVDCEFLKKCCETLTDENRRLQKELQELKSLKLAHRPLYTNVLAATLSMCPLCERAGATACDGGSKRPFPVAPKAHLYSPFSNPSAAC